MPDCTGLTDCRLLLCEAKNAYHELMTTGRAVRVAHADREVEYNKIRAKDLLAYINQLTFECGGDNGESLRRKPIRFGSGGGC